MPSSAFDQPDCRPVADLRVAPLRWHDRVEQMLPPLLLGGEVPCTDHDLRGVHHAERAAATAGELVGRQLPGPGHVKDQNSPDAERPGRAQPGHQDAPSRPLASRPTSVPSMFAPGASPRRDQRDSCCSAAAYRAARRGSRVCSVVAARHGPPPRPASARADRRGRSRRTRRGWSVGSPAATVRPAQVPGLGLAYRLLTAALPLGRAQVTD